MIAEFLAPYLMRIIIGAVITTLAGGAVIGAAVHYENKGYAKAIAAVAAKDRGAINDVHEATKQVDACYSAGRTWNVVDGLCE